MSHGGEEGDLSRKRKRSKREEEEEEPEHKEKRTAVADGKLQLLSNLPDQEVDIVAETCDKINETLSRKVDESAATPPTAEPLSEVSESHNSGEQQQPQQGQTEKEERCSPPLTFPTVEQMAKKKFDQVWDSLGRIQQEEVGKLIDHVIASFYGIPPFSWTAGGDVVQVMKLEGDHFKLLRPSTKQTIIGDIDPLKLKGVAFVVASLLLKRGYMIYTAIVNDWNPGVYLYCAMRDGCFEKCGRSVIYGRDGQAYVCGPQEEFGE